MLDLSSSGNGNGNGSASGNGNGHGDGNGNGKPIGRGGMRGKRMVPQDTPRTKPDHVVTKQGKMGTHSNITTKLGTNVDLF